MTIIERARTPCGAARNEVPAGVWRSPGYGACLRLTRQMVACAGLVAGLTAAQANERAHVHGAIRMEVALEAGNLTVRLDAPLDSLLGFEHRPRTDSQRRAAEALLARMRNAPELLVPTPAAQCNVKDVTVQADVLAPGKPSGDQPSQDKHAELEATYSFRCLQPDKLQSLEVGLFSAFARLQRIDARVVSSRQQSAATLRRPQKVLRIGK
ncbi:MAG: DUF2796 domain-containing protein [Gammaproteobacteria bacterium]|nr:DUF2796 domain-containing protein [Gammaproteobacteria bacterium]